MEDIFEQKSLSFIGKFTSQNEFTVYDQKNFITWYVPNLIRKTNNYTGKIRQAKKKTVDLQT